MNNFSKIPNFSHRLLNRFIKGLVNSHGNEEESWTFGIQAQKWSYQKVLHLKLSEWFDHDLLMDDISHELHTSIESLSQGSKWDLIFISNLFNLFNIREISVLKSISNKISKKGICVLILPGIHHLKDWDKKELYKENGIYPTGILNLPVEFLGSISSIRPIMVCFSKQSNNTCVCFTDYQEEDYQDNLNHFISRHRGEEYSEEDFRNYLKNHARDASYLLDVAPMQRDFTEDNLWFGIFESLKHFPGFEFWKFIASLGEVISDYRRYERCFLKDISFEINLTRESFQEIKNSIFIPLLAGKQKTTDDIKKIDIKHQNVCQVVLDKNKALPRYLVSYLNSNWGKVFWEAAIKQKHGVIKKLTKKDIQNLFIALPHMKIQEDISNIDSKIDNAVIALEGIKQKLALNPISSSEDREKLDSISNSLEEFNHPLLCEESKIHEFKASIRKPFPDYPEPEIKENGKKIYTLGLNEFSSIQQIHKFLESIVLKTVASLLNTNGGNLVIGILEKDNIKEVLGIDREEFESHDKYERHLTQIFINAFGKDVTSNYITTKILQIEKKPVCNVICEQNQDAMPIFYNEEMYIRTGPRVDKLNQKELARYLLKRGK